MVKNTEGYSLVETLVAIAILLLALVGPMTIAAKGIQSSIYVREQTIAISLAQEGIEAFVAARNDATLEAFSNDDLTTSWDWTTDGRIDSCRDADGCNIQYVDADPIDSAVACTGANGAGCELYFDDSSSVRARYTFDTDGERTPYSRAIRVSDSPAGNGLRIESTVYWGTQLLSGQVQSLTLTTEIYNLYE